MNGNRRDIEKYIEGHVCFVDVYCGMHRLLHWGDLHCLKLLALLVEGTKERTTKQRG